MWIKDHIDIGDSIICPHCGGEVGLNSWVLWEPHWCPACLAVVTFEELSEAIDRASLTWIPADWDPPEDIRVSEDEARRLLGEEYETRKSAAGWMK